MKQSLLFSTPKQSAARANIGARGFTLIELMVVLAIVAIVSAITLGGFKEMREGNKSVACQTNLSQIYQASRLYAADEGGSLPFYKNACSGSSAPEGIGLWALYTFPDKADLNGDGKTFNQPAPLQVQVSTTPPKYDETNVPISRYLRSAKSLHCPADRDNENLFGGLNPDAKTEYNLNYLSYQSCDGTTSTYSTQRDVTPLTDPANWKRQLTHYDGANFVSRQPTGDTIVTYCIYHRDQRGMDNVLFYDGSIQSLPAGTAGDARWQRLPKASQ